MLITSGSIEMPISAISFSQSPQDENIAHIPFSSDSRYGPFQRALYALDFASYCINEMWKKDKNVLLNEMEDAVQGVGLTSNTRLKNHLDKDQSETRAFATKVLSYFYQLSNEIDRKNKNTLISKSFPEVLKIMNIDLITRLSKSEELTAPKITERIAKIWIAHLAAPLGIKNVKLNSKTKEYIKENSQTVEINSKVIPGFNCINYAFYVIDPSICGSSHK